MTTNIVFGKDSEAENIAALKFTVNPTSLKMGSPLKFESQTADGWVHHAFKYKLHH
jgi:hypothetical protein